MSANYLFSDLDPDTKYKAFVRCASANHFWKWSDWTQKEFSTPETGMCDFLVLISWCKPKNMG
jgi:oncostatin M receptor